jgi:hypothetical protein
VDPGSESFERVAMMPDLSLAHLTVVSLAPPQMVDVAARTGCRYVGLRLIAVTPDTPGYPLMNDKTMMRETKARLADMGIGVHDGGNDFRSSRRATGSRRRRH